MDSKYVFNEAFIRKNVFVINENGATTDSNVKNNFSGLLLGEDIVKIRNKQNKFTEIGKNVEKSFNEIKEKGKNKLSANYIDYGYSILNDSLIDNSIVLEDCDDIESNLKKYNCKLLNDQYTKINEVDTKIYLAQIKNNLSMKKLVEKIQNTKYLKEYLSLSDNKTNINGLNDKLDELNKNKEDILKIEEILRHKNIENSDWIIINKCLSIQNKSELDECLLCGNANFKKGIAEWDALKNNEHNREKESILEELKKKKKIFLQI